MLRVKDYALYSATMRLINRAKGWGGASLALAPLLIASPSAHAFKLSQFASGWRNEATEIVPVILLLIMGGGVIFAGWATLSAISAKKNQEPLRWQVFGVVGGAVAIIIPGLLLAFAGSITDGNDNAAGVLNDLNINY